MGVARTLLPPRSRPICCALISHSQPNQSMPTKRIGLPISLAALLLLPLLCCSCSMYLVNIVPTKPGAALRRGAHRQELVSVLGQPRSSGARPLTTTALAMVHGNQPSAYCDVYRVSKLVQIRDDPYTSDWNVYPAAVILTLGVMEVITFPYVVVDMTVRSLQRRELLVWYDSSDQLIAYERRRRRKTD